MNCGAKISIIVPIYKSEEYLNRCIDSILMQTYKNIELILVDDGSPDRCGAICDDYSRRDSRVRVIHQENQGVSSARNAGLDFATGDYIGFVDSDDYIETDMYEILFSLMKNTEADIACISMINYDKNGARLLVDEDEVVQVYSSEQAIQNMFWDNTSTCGHLWNKLYKAELFDNLRLDVNIKAREDALIMWELFCRSNCIAFQRKAKYHYMYYPSSAVHCFSSSFLTGREACLILLGKTKEKFPQIKCYAQYYLIEADFQIIAKMVMNHSFDQEYYRKLRQEIKTNLTSDVQKIYKKKSTKNRFSLYLMLHHIYLYKLIKKYI